jgi:hypothetical protein
MVYGRGNSFDVIRMIDMLQALEKFVAVKDLGDGTAFKVGGMRGMLLFRLCNPLIIAYYFFHRR